MPPQMSDVHGSNLLLDMSVSSIRQLHRAAGNSARCEMQ